jgi:hypothetical protein
MAVAMAPPISAPSSDSRFINRSTFVLGLGSATPLSSSNNRAVWRRDRRMAVYHNASTASAGAGTTKPNEVLKTFLAGAKADPSVLKAPESASILALEIGKKLFDLLLKPHEDLNTS